MNQYLPHWHADVISFSGLKMQTQRFCLMPVTTPLQTLPDQAQIYHQLHLSHKAFMRCIADFRPSLCVLAKVLCICISLYLSSTNVLFRSHGSMA